MEKDSLWLKNGKGAAAKLTEKKVPIEFEVPDELGIIFSNHLLISHTADEFFLTFFQLVPPHLIEGGRATLEDVNEIQAKAVARIIIPATRMESFIQAQQNNFDRWKESISKEAT